MHSKKIRYTNPSDKEVKNDIKRNKKIGYILHYSGWIDGKYYELCFVTE